MNCQEVKNLWCSYHDHELDPNLTGEIQRHLKHCAACHRFFAAQQQFEAALTQALKTGQRTGELWQREEALIRTAFAAKPAEIKSPGTAPLCVGKILHAVTSLLWPNPKYYAGLAAVWIVLLMVNWQADLERQTIPLTADSPTDKAILALQRNELRTLLMATDHSQPVQAGRSSGTVPETRKPEPAKSPKAEIQPPDTLEIPEKVLAFKMPVYKQAGWHFSPAIMQET